MVSRGQKSRKRWREDGETERKEEHKGKKMEGNEESCCVTMRRRILQSTKDQLKAENL